MFICSAESVAHGGVLSDTFCRSLYTAAVVRRVVTHTTAGLGLLSLFRASANEVQAPTRDAPESYSQFRCVCPKRWQRFAMEHLELRMSPPTVAGRRVR